MPDVPVPPPPPVPTTPAEIPVVATVPAAALAGPGRNARDFFTPDQRKAVGFSLTMFAIIGAAALGVVTLVLVGRMVGFFSSVIWPLAVAGVAALILRPVVELFERYLHLRRVWAVILLYGLFILVLAGILAAVVPKLLDQIVDFIFYVPTFWDNALKYGQEHYPGWVELFNRQMQNPTVHKIVDSIMAETQEILKHAIPSLRSAGGTLIGGFALVTHVAIIPVYLFFFLLARNDPTLRLPDHLGFLKPDLRADVVFLVREFVTIVESFFRGQILIGLIMGVLLATGFSLVGLRFGLVIGLALGVLNIVPYLGTIMGLAVALPLAFFQPGGGMQLVLLVLMVKLIVQAVEGWALTPKIMGDRTGLHPVTIIVAIFFWGTAFDGILGMLLAIPLTAFFVTVSRLIKQKYLPPESRPPFGTTTPPLQGPGAGAPPSP